MKRQPSAERRWLYGGAAALCIPIAHGVLACGQRTDERAATGRTVSPLQVQVSAEFDVEAYPELLGQHVVHPQIVTCGTLRCFAFYGDNGYVYATRIDQEGRVVDHPPILFGLGAAPVAAAARGDDFVVIWGGPGGIWGAPDDRRATRFRGADGQIVGDFSANVPAADTYRLAATANTWLLIYNGVRAVVKAPETFASIGTPVELPMYNPRTLVPGSDQYLLVWENRALRISETSGAALDAAPIEFSRYTNVSTDPRGAYKNGNYLLAWAAAGAVYGSRIRAADGVRLDPDDDINQVSGARLIYGGKGDVAIGAAYSRSDSILVTWSQPINLTHIETQGARIDIATGSRITGSTSEHELAIPSGSLSMLLNETWGIKPDHNHVSPVQIQQAPLRITGTSSLTRTTFHSAPRTSPRVASNGSSFFVTWRIIDPGPFSSNPSLVGSRISASGQFLDNPPIEFNPPTEFGPAYDNAVAAGGRDYLVSWSIPASFYSGTPARIHRRLVSETGQLGPVLPVIDSHTAEAPALRLVYDGRYFLLAWAGGANNEWTLRAVRLNSDGTAVDASPIVLDSRRVVHDSSARAIFQALATTTPDVDNRTFVIPYKPYDADSVMARRLRSDSGALIGPATNVTAGSFAAGASDGTRMFIAFRNNQSAHAGLLDPTTGLFQNSTTVPLQGIPSGASLDDAWYDGKSYLLTSRTKTSDSYQFAYAIRRWTTELSPLDDAVPGVGTVVASDVTSFSPRVAAAGDGTGRSLFVYERLDPTRMNMAIKARFITNDGLPAPGGGGMDGGGAHGAGGASGSEGGAQDAGDSAGGTGGASAAGGVSGTGGASGTSQGGAAGSMGVGGTLGSDDGGDSGGAAGDTGASGSAGAVATGGTTSVAGGSGGLDGSTVDGSAADGGSEAGPGGAAQAGASGTGGSRAGLDAGSPDGSTKPGAPEETGCRFSGRNPRGFDAIAFTVMGLLFALRHRRRRRLLSPAAT
jgi:hypothetical protein